MFSTETIFDGLRTLDIPVEWHSFIELPKSHAFATYNFPDVEFDGGDDYAMHKWIKAEVHLFFKKAKTPEDFALEEKFENAVRTAGKYTRESGYDSENGLFISKYTFNYGEPID